MNRNAIAAVPAEYSGVRFRSTLEADWAATLDVLGVEWQYEPVAVQLPSGVAYRPDFYLPRIATWLEVKGPHGERLGKTRELANAVCHPPDCHRGAECGGECDAFWNPHQCVVVGLAPVRGEITSYLIDLNLDEDDYDALIRCGSCGAWWWCGSGAYGCRAHRRGGSGDDDFHGKTVYPSFARARTRTGAA